MASEVQIQWDDLTNFQQELMGKLCQGESVHIDNTVKNRHHKMAQHRREAQELVNAGFAYAEAVWGTLESQPPTGYDYYSTILGRAFYRLTILNLMQKPKAISGEDVLVLGNVVSINANSPDEVRAAAEAFRSELMKRYGLAPVEREISDAVYRAEENDGSDGAE